MTDSGWALGFRFGRKADLGMRRLVYRERSGRAAAFPFPRRGLPRDQAPRVAAVLFALLTLPSSLVQQVDPASFPAKDAHEGVLIAADVYADEARSRVRFGKKHPYGVGVLALDLYLRNNNTRPIRVDLQAIRLLLKPPDAAKQQLEAIPLELVLDAIYFQKRGGPDLSIPRVPIPGLKREKNKDWKEAEARLKTQLLEFEVLPPRSTVHGLLFFDLAGQFEWLSGAQLYVPDLKFMDTNQPLFFFEIDLSKSLK
jgi:hypothetical protein